MGSWYLVLAVSLGLIFIGLSTHWSIIVVGAVLPFIPILQMLRARRRSGQATRHQE